MLLTICQRSIRKIWFNSAKIFLCQTKQFCSPSADKEMSASINNIVWVDLEMTGLDDTKDHIMEIACLVTDSQLNIISEGVNLVIHQPDSVLQAMGEWCQNQHTQSGLVAACKNSTITVQEAEDSVLKLIEQYTIEGQSPLAGNSVGEDKRFLQRYMPRLVNHLHYRIIDVSTVKELCKRWHPKAFRNVPKKALTHRALDDIKESIEELKYYRRTFFVDPAAS